MKNENRDKIVWHSYRSWRSYFVWLFFVCLWFFLGLFFPPLMILFFVSSVAIVLHRYGSEYFITQNRIFSIHKYSPGSKRCQIKLKEIDEIEVTHDLWGEIFGYGDVNIGEFGKIHVVFKGITQPEKIAKQIERKI